MQALQEELIHMLKEFGVSDIGFAKPIDAPKGLPCSLSIAVRLSDAVLQEITDRPTYTYFHHYRTVNTFLDQAILRAGMLLQQNGFSYLPVAASQSLHDSPYEGRYSHKKAACLSGMGFLGKNNLFFHREYGSKVRLATLFTDFPFECENTVLPCPCENCTVCAKACPAHAISGNLPTEDFDRDTVFDPEKCSQYMKKQFQLIGRGSVCGICIRVCPLNRL